MNLHKSIIDLLDKSYELIYIDYRENLDDKESLKALQNVIQGQNWEKLDEITEDWFMESRWNGMEYAIKELRESIKSYFDVDEDRAQDFIDKYQDYIEDEIYERDTSNPIKDLLRNTSEPVCFYDTGYYVESGLIFGTEEDMQAEVKAIKKVLKISTDKYDDKLYMMLAQASYGGRLVVYFMGDWDDLLNLQDKNIVTFKNPMVAIIDTWNGSGDNTDLPGHEFTMFLDKEEIYLDRCIHYSYTYDVCGMISDWCDCTSVKFGKDKRYKRANHG